MRKIESEVLPVRAGRGVHYNYVEQYTTAAQKRLGRAVVCFDEAKWTRIRYDIRLRKLLLATTETFVEASPTDRVWGIGMKKIEHRESVESESAREGYNSGPGHLAQGIRT